MVQKKSGLNAAAAALFFVLAFFELLLIIFYSRGLLPIVIFIGYTVTGIGFITAENKQSGKIILMCGFGIHTLRFLVLMFMPSTYYRLLPVVYFLELISFAAMFLASLDLYLGGKTPIRQLVSSLWFVPAIAAFIALFISKFSMLNIFNLRYYGYPFFWWLINILQPLLVPLALLLSGRAISLMGNGGAETSRAYGEYGAGTSYGGSAYNGGASYNGYNNNHNGYNNNYNAYAGGAPQYNNNMYAVETNGYISMGSHVLLLLFTFGIWLYVWIYRTTKFTNQITDEPQRNPTTKLLLCMFVPFYYIYWVYKTGQRIDRLAASRGIPSDIAWLSLVLAIFVGIVAPIIMQDKINEISAGSAYTGGYDPGYNSNPGYTAPGAGCNAGYGSGNYYNPGNTSDYGNTPNYGAPNDNYNSDGNSYNSSCNPSDSDRRYCSEPEHQNETASSESVTEQLKAYKELLDSGIITQEEFDAKKKQLLGL